MSVIERQFTFGQSGCVEFNDAGMVNATRLCASGGKMWSGYVRNAGTEAFLTTLEGSLQKDRDELITQNPRGNNSGRDTWVHPEVASHLSQWVGRVKQDKGESGLVYAVSSPIINVVKIGKWSGSIKSLRGRYVSSYGPGTTTVTARVGDCGAVESALHNIFQPFAVGGELFEKECWDAVKTMIGNM